MQPRNATQQRQDKVRRHQHVEGIKQDNIGLGVYGLGVKRSIFRATGMHNTLLLAMETHAARAGVVARGCMRLVYGFRVVGFWTVKGFRQFRVLGM